MRNERVLNVFKTNIIPICMVIGIFILSILLFGVHRNDIQEFQVVQSVTGNISIKSDGGYYFSLFPRKWKYLKVDTVFFSNEKDESPDNDGVIVRFSNKGQGDVSSQVVYRLYNGHESMLRMHEYATGDRGKIEDLILAKLKNIIMEKASNITSSQAIEDREALATEIRKDIVNNAELANIGIVIEQYSITNIDFDSITTALFEAQQRADLQKKTAEAERENLAMQKERTEAEYAQKIAASKGAAEVEMMKQVTDAERQKKLAEIEAQKKVAIETLAKEEALVKASKLLELAEIDKKTEAEKLEVVRLQAEQKITIAKAREQEIQLSGAITETQRVTLETEMKTKVDIAKHIAEGISKMKLPETFIMGGGNGGVANPADLFFQLMNAKTAKELNEKPIESVSEQPTQMREVNRNQRRAN